MKPLSPHRLARTGTLAARILAGSIAALLSSHSAWALDFSWDPANDADGGTGAWNTSSLFWDSGNTSTAANTNIAWANGATNNAYFAGTAGTVTLGAAITAGSLNFGTAGYQLTLGNNALTLNAAGTGVATLNLNGTGALNLKSDGDGTGGLQSIDFLQNVVVSNAAAITVGKIGGNVVNKTLQLGTLEIGAQTLTVTPSNGFGLEFTGATVLTAAPTFSVGTATASNVVQGLTLTGQITGAFGLTKSGAGTLVLGDATNSFGTGGSIINITDGILQVSSNGALGDSGNVVNLSANSATKGLRLAGGTAAIPSTYTLAGRAITLNASASGIDVTDYTTTTLDTAFGFSAAANTLQKNGNGVLAFSSGVDNSGLTGTWTISAGAIQIAGANNLNAGASAVTVSNTVGSALQLTNGVTLNKAGTLTINNSGFNGAGSLQSVGAFANAVSSLITLGSASTIGADNNSILDLSGGITGAFGLTFNTAGNGAININTTAISANVTPITKIGSGTLTFDVSSPSLVAPINVNAGTFAIGTGVLGGTGLVTVHPGAILNLTSTSANRLGGRPLTLSGGTINLSGAAAETTGNVTLNPGQSTINNTSGSTLTLGGTLARVAGSSVLFKGGSTINFGALQAFTGLTTTGGTATTQGIYPWAIFDSAGGLGSSFATASAGQITVRELAVGEGVNSLTANSNAVLTSNPAATNSVSINSLTFNATSSAVTVNSPTLALPTVQTLTINSGGILSNVATSSISGGVVAATHGIIFTPGANAAANTLTISSAVTGTTLTKAGGGMLVLSSESGAFPGYSANAILGASHAGGFFINEGTLQLGANNALSSPTVLGNGNNSNALTLNAGAFLDLNGKTQFVGPLYGQAFNSSGLLQPGVAGGTVNSTTGAGNLILLGGNPGGGGPFTFGGSITGTNVGFASGMVYSTAAAWSQQLVGPNSYGGPTLIYGGATFLKDDGTMSGTSDIAINYSILAIDNAGVSTNVSLSNNNDRVKDTAGIALSGGTLSYLGRAQTASTETVGAINLVQGVSTIAVTTGGTGVNSADLTVGSIDRTAGSGATVAFSLSGTAGSVGSGNGRINVNSPASFTAEMVNGIIPWAAVAGGFATYTPYTTANGISSGGIGILGTAGYAAYNTTATTYNAVNQPTWNASASGTTTVTGSVTLNSLTFSASGGGENLNFTSPSDTLNVVSGGLLINGNVNTIGATLDSGRITAGGTASTGTVDLYLWSGSSNNNSNTLNSRLIDNGNGASTRLVLTFRGDGNRPLTMNNGSNSYTGGTVLNTSANLNATSGVVIPDDLSGLTGLVINGSTVTMNNKSGQIGSANIVTLNGSSTLNLFQDNTLAGLVLNNTGGASTTVNTGGGLTLTGGITSTSNNVNGLATINGRVSIPATSTLNIGAATFNGQIINPLRADLIVMGLAGGGTTTKSGLGVLQFNQPTTLTGTLDVTAGGLQIGGAGAGARLADVTLQDGTWLNLNAQDALFGSLGTSVAGTGIVTNTGALKTLTVGFSGANTSFEGSFIRFNDTLVNAINLTKIGTGSMTLTSNASTASGTLTISGGVLSFADSGTNNFTSGTTVVNQTGTLTLDNSGTVNVNNRFVPIGVNLGLTLNGGAFTYIGRDGTSSIDANGTGALTFGPGESTVTANEGAGGTSLLTFGSLGQNAGSSFTFAGTNLGTAADKVMLTGQANGAVLFRGAVGNDFAVYDTTLGVKAYTAYNTNTNVNSGTGNFMLDATTTLRDLTAARSLGTLNIADNGVTIGTNGTLLPTAGLTLSSAAVLVNGTGATISTPVLALGAEGIFRVNGSNDFDVNSRITGGQALTKTGAGTLTISKAANYTGTTYVNQGTLRLNSGQANTLPVLPTASTPTLAALNVNGGSFDINGQNQAVGNLSNNNTNAGTGGSIINSGATATFTSAAAGNTTFAGQIGGGTDASPTDNDLNFIKTGNNTLTLTSPNTYSGTTTLRGGGLVLKDGGTLLSSSTAAIHVIGGTLTVDQSGLNPVVNPTRISATSPLTLSGGGALALSGGYSADSSLTLNTVTTASGTNILSTTTPFVQNLTGGGTSTLTIGSLVQGSTQAGIRYNPPRSVIGLGQAGMGGNKIIITNITPAGGSSVPTESLLVNGLLPGWMNVITSQDNGGNFFRALAGYLPSPVNGAQGVGALGSTGYPAYNVNVLVANATATQNLFMYNNAGNPAQTAVTTRTVNSINYSRDWGWSMASQTDTLTIGTGTFLNDYSGQVGSMNINGGQLTSGTDALYMNIYDDAIILNSSVVDGAGPVALLKQGASKLTIDPRVNIYNNNTALYLSGVSSFNLGTMSTASALFAGMGVTGTGIQAGTIITGIAGTTVSLSLPTTGASVAGNLIFTAPTAVTSADGSTTITNTATDFVPTVGMTVTGPGTTPGTRITVVGGSPGAYSLTLSNTVAAGTPTLSYGAQSNSYTGGTFVNEGTLTFPAAVSSPMIPGDLTLNGSLTNASVVTTTAAGQLPTTTNVTINGGGTLTMVGTNTLASLTFDNVGLTSTVAGSTSLTLSAANAITATNDNLSVTPSITGTALLLSNAAPVINVAGASPDGLLISAPITSAGGAISKTGTGSLILSVANSFSTGVNLDGGALIVDNNTALGSGTLAIGTGTALMSGTAIRTLNNLVSVAGDFTLGTLSPAYGTAAANNGVILSNTVTLAGGAHQITVDGLLNVSTISGKLTGGTDLTKAGPGTLLLSNAANDFGGTTTVTGGTLKSGATNALTATTDLTVDAGAAFDMAGFAQTLSTLNGAGLVANSSTSQLLTLGNSTPTSGSFSGSITNASLLKNGTNTQVLSGFNTYTGTTTVSAGTLSIGTGGSLANTAVTVQSTGTLAGVGTIGGSTTIQGIHSPGNSAGLQTFTNGLAYASTSTLLWELMANTESGRGSNFDAVDVTGGSFSITSGATLDLSFGGTVSFVDSFWNAAHTWTIADLGIGLTGDGGSDLFTLGSITGGSYSPSEGTFTVTRVADVDGKNDVVLNWAASAGSPYQTWIDSYGAIPIGDRDPEDDYDKDGVTNLAEFAFKGVPNDASNRGLFFNEAKDNADGDSDKELTFTCAVRRSAVNFAANGDNAQESLSPIDEVTYTIEGSTTLTGTWNSVVSYVGKSDTAPSGSGLPSLAGTDWEYRTFSAFNGMANKGFLRTKVVRP